MSEHKCGDPPAPPPFVVMGANGPQCGQCEKPVGLRVAAKPLPPMGQAFLSHVDELQAKIRRTERERDEYQAQVHTLTERVSAMTSAASSAAASTVTAIERIQEMEKVLKAAEAWVMGGSHAALVEAVQVWKKYKGSWS